MDTLKKLKTLQDLRSLKIRLASPEEIREWSYGEVTKPETINYRTLKTEKDGLFDERIFGPTKDWECYCGKYKRIRYKGVICDKCGVEVTESRVRRERMGHISLAAPAVHVWFFKGAPSKASLLLGLPPRALEQVVYFARYLAISVDEKKRKEAIKILEEVLKSRVQEIKDFHQEKLEQVRTSIQEGEAKVKERIKNKEQLSLALEEIALEARKRRVSIQEEERTTLEKTRDLFNALIKVAQRIKPLEFLSEEEYDELASYGASGFLEVKMGAEAILEAFKLIDLNRLSEEIRQEISEIDTKSARYLKLTKRLKVIDGIREAKINPAWMIIKVLPVLPPDLRPMVQLSGGRFAASDLNDLYRRVINRNNRLKHLIELGAPEIILRNEKRMLQEAVDSLIDSSQRKATRRGRGRQPLRSLSDMLKGKQGRFRQNLLGKRVDYSGRSVIVVGPELNLTECGLPKEMALEMFKPFVLREMILRGVAPNVKSAKNMLERRPPEIFDILEEITRNHPILLNRAPTLHKLGIQAFYPILVGGNAIRVHPAVCRGYNADFDGDQMAAHVPLSQRAIKESLELMKSDKNLLRVADGSPISTPASKEMALGVYFLTSEDPRLEPYPTVFADSDEAILAYRNRLVELRQQVQVRVRTEVLETTVGRIIFNQALPESFSFVNQAVDAPQITALVTEAFVSLETEEVARLIDAIKNLGFFGGTVSGLSFGIADAEILPEKEKIINQADRKVTEIETNFVQGLITEEEKKRLIQEVWIETTEEIADRTWELLDPNGSIRVVVDAKVGRTSRNQIKQLAGMRGLVVDPLGNIVDLPTKGNFREGLSVFEYVTSSRGSRKGLTDTALKTADAGYLTRRLVDVAHDVIIREEDCGTDQGLVIKRDLRSKSFGQRIFGRFLVEDVRDKKGKLLLAKNELVTEEKALEIEAAGVEEVVIFSPLTCHTRYGVCVKCYGWDLSNKKKVQIGVPVGVIAAQSIGEPGTQLTLKTKHTGGVVGVDITQGLPRVEELFEARIPKILSPLSEIDGRVSIEEKEAGWLVKVKNNQAKLQEERDYLVPKASQLKVDSGDKIEAGTQLATGFLDIKEVLTVRGLREAQLYLINELQAVYESQGIPINDRHFEVITRKMSDEVKIVTPGDTAFLPGELVEKPIFEEKNEAVLAAGGEPASARQLILGIGRRSLYTESWLSAASFEQTTGVLTESALLGKIDRLLGLKENVIIGRLIPVTESRVSGVKVKV